MNKQEALNAIERGTMVDCTKKDYEKEIRTAIQQQAGKWVDDGDHVRAIIALQEVKRLDNLFAVSKKPAVINISKMLVPDYSKSFRPDK